DATPREPPPDQQSARNNHFCCRRQDGRRRHQRWRQEPQESGGVGGESFKVAPCHPGDAKLAPQAEAIGNRGEEREGQGHAKQPDREPAKMRLVEHGWSPRAVYFFSSGIVICWATTMSSLASAPSDPAADDQVLKVLGTHDDAPFRRERLMPRPARWRATPRRATRARCRAGPGP